MKRLYKRQIISSVTALIIIVGLLVVSYFFDLKISENVATLSDGAYYSSNKFARFFEVFGEDPIYLMLSLALALVFNGINKIINHNVVIKIIKIACAILSTLSFAYMVNKIFKYTLALNNNTAWFDNHTILIYGIGILIGAPLTFLTIFLTYKIKDEYKRNLVYFGFIVILTVIFSQVGVQLVKPFVGRMRYRAIYVLNENGYSNLATFSKLFHFNGKGVLTEEMLNLGLDKDIFKSFPSGHTAAAAVVLCLGLLPNVLNLEGAKYKQWHLILWWISFNYVLIVAYARIKMGAHYFSDVLVGGSFTFVMMLISYLIVQQKYKEDGHIAEEEK